MSGNPRVIREVRQPERVEVRLELAVTISRGMAAAAVARVRIGDEEESSHFIKEDENQLPKELEC